MIKALKITKRAFIHWYDEFLVFMIFNIVWFVLQLGIVTGPAATAAMYAVARNKVRGEYLSLNTGWNALRQLFKPALKWGVVYAVIVGVILVNFKFYQGADGIIWGIIRILWALVGMVWAAMNLFYWPFWMSQSDKRMTTTLKNTALFLLKRPGYSLSLVALCAILTILSILTTLPFIVLLISLLALIGALAVEDEIKD